MLPVTDEHAFWNLTDAAAEIFGYVDRLRDEIGHAFGFDKGSTTDDGDSAYAVFSCLSSAGIGRDVLTVSARRDSLSGWTVTHELQKSGEGK